ncbi:hypothetical protein A6302_04531 [Methylobrevis pamukkalensis]|uniref:Uncharacterized protein n=1 Tax=Methylobrevis pamukkalensis TaxID=1439726 RepID=A0A1E3GN80_9HYPH|nr:hypothetical protein A6302_04531 [Methylobrevis pamukkalensis]
MAGSTTISSGVTAAPSRRFCAPSTISRSPAETPSVTTQSLPDVRLAVITRVSALSSAVTNIAVVSPRALWPTARCGSRKAPSISPSESSARTYMPGSSSRRGLAIFTRIAKVPVASLTVASADWMEPTSP